MSVLKYLSQMFNKTDSIMRTTVADLFADASPTVNYFSFYQTISFIFRYQRLTKVNTFSSVDHLKDSRSKS